MKSTLDLRATRKGVSADERNHVDIEFCCCVIYVCGK
jgi:hypothetical protein